MSWFKSKQQMLIQQKEDYLLDWGHTNLASIKDSIDHFEKIIYSDKIQNNYKLSDKSKSCKLNLLNDILSVIDNELNLGILHKIDPDIENVIEELDIILNNPNFKAIMESHDDLRNLGYGGKNHKTDFIDEENSENYEMDEFGLIASDFNLNSKEYQHNTNAIRIVGIRKNEDEPLGITIKEENNKLVIARILAGSLVDRQGMLHVNDIILEVNGCPVEKPEVLQEIIRKNNSNSIQLKVIPSFNEQVAQLSCHMKALFNYDPSLDSLLPCKELGLPFVQGDILEILNQEDANWWQARKVDTLNHHNSGNPQMINQQMILNNQQIGLIPSQELEEKRRAFVRPEFDYASKTSICGTRVIKKKKKSLYSINSNTSFDNAELIFYEEMCKLNKFQRKCIVLIGASGVGRRTLKQRLIQSEPDKFAGVLPHTSRPIREGEVNGKMYHFIHRDIMEREIEDSHYLEYGELQGHLYGTKLDSIRNVIRQGKICVIDCNPQSLKLLKVPEFMPYVVFLGAPPLEQLRFMHDWGRQNNASRNCTFDRAMGRSSRRAKTLQSLASFYEDEDLSNTIEESNRIMRIYEKNFDLCLVNYNFEKTYHQLREAIHQLETEPQWVPISWVLHAE